QAFLAGVTLGKTMTFGMPVFGKKQDFIDMMAGKGMLGQIFAALQIKPVTFKSPKDVMNSISLKSHRFSIYADGIVPGYKRMTKVRIHAVIDTTHAGQLGAMGTVIVGGGQAAAAAMQAAAALPPSVQGSSSSSSSSGSTTPAAGTPDAIAAQLGSNPAG